MVIYLIFCDKISTANANKTFVSRHQYHIERHGIVIQHHVKYGKRIEKIKQDG